MAITRYELEVKFKPSETVKTKEKDAGIILEDSSYGRAFWEIDSEARPPVSRIVLEYPNSTDRKFISLKGERESVVTTEVGSRVRITFAPLSANNTEFAAAVVDELGRGKLFRVRNEVFQD